ncbi:unnamed protein product [Caenorhabditis auriculariae]|uniref:Uncharacterized protein n=1 Tax=Caenorhabditis auriculariae TaxID=2777116 RepID=A0A8S1H5Y0_9PELO|nr:unnamed protein product [Caenorhabditis auriculariae]
MTENQKLTYTTAALSLVLKRMQGKTIYDSLPGPKLPFLGNYRDCDPDPIMDVLFDSSDEIVTRKSRVPNCEIASKFRQDYAFGNELDYFRGNGNRKANSRICAIFFDSTNAVSYNPTTSTEKPADKDLLALVPFVGDFTEPFENVEKIPSWRFSNTPPLLREFSPAGKARNEFSFSSLPKKDVQRPIETDNFTFEPFPREDFGNSLPKITWLESSTHSQCNCPHCPQQMRNSHRPGSEFLAIEAPPRNATQHLRDHSETADFWLFPEPSFDQRKSPRSGKTPWNHDDYDFSLGF